MPADEVSKKPSIQKPSRSSSVDENGPAIDKILQEEHDLILVGDETPKEGIANMEKG